MPKYLIEKKKKFNPKNATKCGTTGQFHFRARREMHGKKIYLFGYKNQSTEVLRVGFND